MLLSRFFPYGNVFSTNSCSTSKLPALLGGEEFRATGETSIWLGRAFIITQFTLKVCSCELYNSRYMITSTQVTNTEIFAFIAVLVFKLWSHKMLFINRKDSRNC